MLGFRDNTTLALTKLRTRQIRLVVTLIVSGLLFSVLILASLLIRGNLASITDFTKDGFGNRFLLSIVSPQDAESAFDPVVVKRAQAIQKEFIAKKTAEAKRLGVPYDPSTEPDVTTKGGPQGPDQIGVNSGLPAAKQAISEIHPYIDMAASIKAVAQGYNLHGLYAGSSVINSENSGGLTPIIDGKEIKTSQSFSVGQDTLESFSAYSSTLDNILLKPFLFQGADLNARPGEPIPILAPVDAAEKLLKLAPLNPKATNQDKYQRLSDLRSRSRDLQFSVCYRNRSATDLITQAKQQADEAAAAKNTPGYTAPSVQYAASTTPCLPIQIIKDTRSAEEKAAAAKLEQFNNEFGNEAPVTGTVKFRIVGLLPKVDYGASAFDMNGLFSSFLTSTLGPGWYMSHQAAIADPIMGPILKSNTNNYTYYAEFADRPSQKRFLDNKSCQPDPGGAISGCTAKQKYMMSPFGNPLAPLYDNQKDIMNFINNVVLGIAVLSAIIMMGTVGKIIADSRKETSVFRAVGAKRLDIAQIYLLYAGILSALSFLLALSIGLGISLFMESQYTTDLSIQAVLAFNSSDIHKVYHIVGFNPIDLLKILGLTIFSGLLSAAIPLAASLSRNPIKDMREE